MSEETISRARDYVLGYFSSASVVIEWLSDVSIKISIARPDGRLLAPIYYTLYNDNRGLYWRPSNPSADTLFVT